MYEHLNTATAFLSPHSTTATILETLLCMRFLFILVLSPFTHKNLSKHFYKWTFKQVCIDVHRCKNCGTLLLSLDPPLWSRSLRHRVGKLYRFNKNCCAGDGEDGVTSGGGGEEYYRHIYGECFYGWRMHHGPSPTLTFVIIKRCAGAYLSL